MSANSEDNAFYTSRYDKVSALWFFGLDFYNLKRIVSKFCGQRKIFVLSKRDTPGNWKELMIFIPIMHKVI